MKEQLEPQININQRSGKSPRWYTWVWWLFVALTCALLVSNLAGDTLKTIFFSLLAGLTPIIAGVIIVFLLLQPINWIEEKLLKNAFIGNPKAKIYKRWISLSICYLVIITIFALILAFAIPYIVEQLQNLVANRDVYIEKIEAELTELVSNLTSLSDTQVQESISSMINSFVDMISQWVTSLQNDISNIVSIIVSFVVAILMGLIISFLILKDKELIASTARRYTYAYNTRKKADEILATTRRSTSMLNQWLVSNLIVMAILFAVSWVGYLIIGVPLSFVCALLLALLSIVPYIGGFIALIPLGLMCLVFGTVTQALIGIIFSLIVWALITTFIPPIIFSKRLQTRSLVIILAMIIFGSAFGIWGMILAAPVASMIMIVMQERMEVKEALREREELVDAGIIEEDSSDSIAEMLDLTEDIDPVLTLEEANEENTVGIRRRIIRASNKKQKSLKLSNSKNKTSFKVKDESLETDNNVKKESGKSEQEKVSTKTTKKGKK